MCQALGEIQEKTHLDTFCFAACFLSQLVNTIIIYLVGLLQSSRTSQSLDHVYLNIVITLGQRKKVSNRRIPNMFTRQKDRKATKLSSSKLAPQILMSEAGHLRIRVESFKTCQQRVNKRVRFISSRKEG